MMTAEALIEEGFEVIEAWNGDAAAELLDGSGCFDIVLTDVRMPGRLDGIDLALHARRLCPLLPLLVVSGYADNLAERLAVFKPPVCFLPKPYDLRKVSTVVRRLTETA